MAQRKLLLADDSITIQKVVNLTFADEGIEVITVGDGDSAMQKITEIAPDLVMADVNMPGLSGYEVCEKIRSSENLKSTPVILLVGSFEPFDEEKARTVGADDFLTKPFQSIRQLVSKVTDLLNGETSKNGEGNAAAITSVSADSEGETELANAETLRNFSSSQTAQNLEYGDAGMDDEMIETNRADNFAATDSNYHQVSEPEFESKTQPLNAEDLKEFSFSEPSTEPSSVETVETGSDSANEQTEEAEHVFAQSQNEEAYVEEDKQNDIEDTDSSSPVKFEFNDDDLLEIPFEEDEEDEEDIQTSETSQAEADVPATETPVAEDISNTEENYIDTTGAIKQSETEQQNFSETQNKESESSAVITDSASQLSPEMIEAIVQKVVEKLSDKAVKDVAWEVVPEMADLIIKKMAEERLKE